MQDELRAALKQPFVTINEFVLKPFKKATGEEYETTKGGIIINRFPLNGFSLSDQPPHIDLAASRGEEKEGEEEEEEGQVKGKEKGKEEGKAIIVMVALSKKGFTIKVRAWEGVLITAFTNGRLVLSYTNSLLLHDVTVTRQRAR